jgi:hypothetical protein
MQAARTDAEAEFSAETLLANEVTSVASNVVEALDLGDGGAVV